MLTFKKYVVWMLLALTLCACYWVSQQGDGAAENDIELQPAAHTPVQARPLARHAQLVQPIADINAVATRSDVDLSSAQKTFMRPVDTDAPHNIFTSFSPPAPDAEDVGLTAEAPPAMPFSYAGKLVDDGEVMVFLTENQQNYSVKVGDVLHSTWKIESIAPPMMTIKYIPLNIDMQLRIGALS